MVLQRKLRSCTWRTRHDREETSKRTKNKRRRPTVTRTSFLSMMRGAYVLLTWRSETLQPLLVSDWPPPALGPAPWPPLFPRQQHFHP